MNEILSLLRVQLREGGYDVATVDDTSGSVIQFESDSILGFILFFNDAATLLEDWKKSSQRVLNSAQLALRRAGDKAWNTYLVLLAQAEGDYGESVMLRAIEEDLVGTRKIVRAGIGTSDEVHAALLPLFAIENSPHLEAIDMQSEIRQRTSELPEDIVNTFLEGATDSTLVQLMETSQ